MVGDFEVRVDFDARRMSVACAECRDALVVDLAEPGMVRVLSLFASNHRHSGDPRPFRLEAVAD